MPAFNNFLKLPIFTVILFLCLGNVFAAEPLNGWLEHGCSLSSDQLQESIQKSLNSSANSDEKQIAHLIAALTESERLGYKQVDLNEIGEPNQQQFLSEQDRLFVKAKYFENQLWEVKKAKKIYKKLAKQKYQGVERELGVLLLKNGEFRHAYNVLSLELRKNFNVRTAIHAAKSAYMSNNVDAAKKIFTELFTRWPDCTIIRRDYIYFLAVTNEYAAAASFIEKYLDTVKNQDADVFFEKAYLGYSLGHTGDLKKALEVYQQLDYPPGFGWINALMGNNADAKTAIDTLLRERMHETIWRNWDVSYIYQEMGDEVEAKAWLYKMAVALHETKPQEYKEWLWRLKNEKDFHIFHEDNDYWSQLVRLSM